MHFGIQMEHLVLANFSQLTQSMLGSLIEYCEYYCPWIYWLNKEIAADDEFCDVGGIAD